MSRFKQNSRIPMPVAVGPVQVGDPPSRSESAQSNQSTDDKTKIDSSRSTGSTRSRNNMSKSKPTMLNPLAKKAMEKRPRSRSKPNKGVKTSSETWYEEKVETQSQLRYQETKTTQEKRKEELLKQLKEAEAEVEVMKNLLVQRDKVLKDAQEEADNQIKSLEEKLEDKEETLIINGIDPVTGQPAMPSQEEKVRTQKLEKFTKKKIQDMRERLTKMNKETESYLADIENTMQYLDSLEVASDRMGPLSEETRRFFGDFENEEDLIAKVYDENNAARTENDSEHKQKTEKEEDHQEEVVDQDENKNEDLVKSQFFITHRDTQSQSRITQHNDTTQ